MNGHAHLAVGAPGVGPCVRCGTGPLNVIHQTRYGNPDVEHLGLRDQVADLNARLVKARDLAHTFRAATTSDVARAGFASIIDTLDGTHATLHALPTPEPRKAAA